MSDVMTSILTDAAARDHASVEQSLMQQADLASPWASVAKE
jgi:hypothetical protein